ncbi:MAG: hypothetical protein FJX75_08205 [Armatimonadetes bacterium]|nr:hypothetical protein [Armatimonadota bacterium]
MTLDELRNLATARFGPRLERADPESLAQFLLEVQPLLPGTQEGGPISVDGAAPGYVEAMREYFAETLYGDPDRVAASLWITAVEMWLGAVQALDE